MIEYKDVGLEGQAIDKFICDKCNKKIDSEDLLEMQETISICLVGGYNSVFGDSNRVQCDLCQNCLHELIKDYCRIVDHF